MHRLPGAAIRTVIGRLSAKANMCTYAGGAAVRFDGYSDWQESLIMANVPQLASNMLNMNGSIQRITIQMNRLNLTPHTNTHTHTCGWLRKPAGFVSLLCGFRVSDIIGMRSVDRLPSIRCTISNIERAAAAAASMCAHMIYTTAYYGRFRSLHCHCLRGERHGVVRALHRCIWITECPEFGKNKVYIYIWN